MIKHKIPGHLIYIKNQAGQDLIEFALLLPLLLLVIFGIIDFAIVIFSYDSISNAAREGARYAVVHQTASDADIEEAALRLTAGLDPEDITVAVNRPGDNTVQVDVTYALSLITGPVIQAVNGQSAISLHTMATMIME